MKKNYKIKTPIPSEQALDLYKRIELVEARAMHGQLPVVWGSAKGSTVKDPWGNRWIDFTSTIFVANSGHGNRKIIRAIKKVLRKPLLHSYTYLTKERLEYLEYLISVTPSYLEKAFLVSAGTEATEAAVKLARLEAKRIGKRRRVVITSTGNWHGRTMGAQLLSSNIKQKDWLVENDIDFLHIPFPYPWNNDAMKDPSDFFEASMNELISEFNLDPSQDIACFLFETYQGWGSVFYPPEYIQAAEKFAREHSALLIFDEMQSGFGRTGTLFGYQHYGVTPDIICCGKGASSSLPLAFILGRASLLDLPETGSMSSTHSANPLSCAAGLANLKALLEDEIISNSKITGDLFQESLNSLKNKYSEIDFVLGKGMVAALIFKIDDPESGSKIATEIAHEAMRLGLLVVHTGRESIKLAPPLTISRRALLEGLEILDRSIDNVTARQK